MKERLLGQYIVLNSEGSYRVPVFRGSELPVADVLNRVAANEDWNILLEDYRDAVSIESISAAVRLARNVFMLRARVPPKDELDAPPTILGEYLVADPAICHGRPTFRGTRIFVADVLDEVACRMDWETIRIEWRGSVSHEAIAEAIRVAGRMLLDHVRVHEHQPIAS
jgi:uncharacterized protein (DUF433 family)